MKFIYYLFFSILLSSFVFAAVPVIDDVVINGTNFNPLENSTVTVRVDFNVTDLDGVANLNNSACKCEFDNNAIWGALYENATDTSCDNVTINANTTQYICEVNMPYWYENNTYSVNVTVKDNETFVSNATQTFVYSQLIASSLDSLIINFGTIASTDYGTNKTSINSTTVTNTGNKVLNLKITGADLSDDAGIASNVSISQFYVDIDNNATGATQLTNSQQTITNAFVPVEDSTPGGNTEEIWWFFNVPDPLEAGTYSGTWVLEES